LSSNRNATVIAWHKTSEFSPNSDVFVSQLIRLSLYSALANGDFNPRSSDLDLSCRPHAADQSFRRSSENGSGIVRRPQTNNVVGDPNYGPDSDLGHVRKSERKSGLTRKGKTGE
jgi:hypothetical protein